MKTVIEMARDAGFTDVWIKPLERFAALVRAEEQMKALEVARTIGGDWAAKFEQEYLK